MLTYVYDGTKINITDYDDCNDIKWYTDLNDANFLEHISDETLKKSTIIVPTNKLIKDNTHKIRNIVNPKDPLTKDKEYNGYIYRINDKIIHCKNFKSENLFNGKTGTISDINTLYIEVMFYTINKDDEERYEDKPYQYKFKEEFIKYLIPAYMITCHKSQGSQ